MKGWCIHQVRDHTDHNDCGKRPVIGTTQLCEEHLVERIEDLRQEVAKAERVLFEKRDEYTRMHIALERHRLPLLAKVL